MPTLAELWLPIVVSAVAVWIVSAIVWMAMPHHKGDFKSLPDEDGTLAYVRSQNLAPGIYGFPDCQDEAKKKDPVFLEKLKTGPLGTIHVWPPNAFENFGSKLVMVFMVYLIIGTLVAYLGTLALPKGVEFIKVFRFAATAGIMAYTLSRLPNDICFNVPRKNIINGVIDGIAYGLVVGAVFGWMWPKG